MADAYLIPKVYPRLKAGDDRLIAIKNEFGPLFGCKVVQMRSVHLGTGVVGLLTRKADDPSYFFPSGHPLQGRERYDWKDRGDGVLEGTLYDDETTQDERVKAQAEHRAKMDAFLESPEGKDYVIAKIKKMEASGILKADEAKGKIAEITKPTEVKADAK